MSLCYLNPVDDAIRTLLVLKTVSNDYNSMRLHV